MATCKKESSGTGDRKFSEEVRHCGMIILNRLVFSFLELLDFVALHAGYANDMPKRVF